jgi:hypothetical protein
MLQRTVLFEKHYQVDVGEFKTTDDVDRFLEKRSGRKLGVVRISGNIVEKTGNILPVKQINVDNIIDKAISQ